MLEAIRKIPDICRTKPAEESHTNSQKRSRIRPRTIKNQQWMFTRLQIVSPFSEKSANEITDARARLALRVLQISRNACISPPHTHAAGEWQCMWICRLRWLNTVSARSAVLCKSQRGFSKAKQIVKYV